MVNELRKQLLNSLECNGEDIITEAIKAIRSTLDCDMCTLWSINHNNTDSEIGEFVSASLLIRSLKEEIEYLNRCDQIIVLSETDRKKLQKEGVETLYKAMPALAADPTTYDLTKAYLLDEEEDQYWDEEQLDLIEKIGYQNWLVKQL